MAWKVPDDYAPDQGAINAMRTNPQPPGSAEAKLMAMIDEVRSAGSVGLTLQQARELFDSRVVETTMIAEIAAVADGDAATDPEAIFEAGRGA